MSIVLVWSQVTRTATFDKGRWVGSHQYIVYDSTGQSITITDIANGASAYQTFGGGAETTFAAYLTFTSQTLTPIPDAADKQWSVSMVFESLMGDGSAPTVVDVKSENRVGFTAIECNIQESAVDIWRTGATVPTNGAQDDVNIGGTPVDSAGEPISLLLPITTISIRNVIDGRPQYATILAIAGKRNSASFTFGASGNTFTCALGTLVFTGAHTSRIGPNTYEINYQFSYDPTLYHMRQSPMRDLNGVMTSRTTPTSPVSVTNKETATTVWFRQPFPSLTAFSALGIVST